MAVAKACAGGRSNMKSNEPLWMRWLVNVNLLIGSIAVFAMLLHIIVDVTARHLFHVPVQGTLEIVSYYYMVGLVYLAIPVVQARSQHIFVELFTTGLSRRMEQIIDGSVRVFTALALAFFAWITMKEAIYQTGVGTVVEAGTGTIAVWPTRWLLPFSLISTTLICLWQALQLFKGSIQISDNHGVY